MTISSLKQLSSDVAALTQTARGFTLAIRSGETRLRTGTLWRADLCVTSEQSLPKADAYEIELGGSQKTPASLVGRDPGTNVAVLKLATPAPISLLPEATEALPGALALAFGSDGHGGIAARLGLVSSVAPEWHSRAGGRIDRRIGLDLDLSYTEEGGPVLDAEGRLLGMSTLGVREHVLAIPPVTVERSVVHLLAHGRVERGWLGVSVWPVAVPPAQHEAAGQKSGLMVMSTVENGPAAAAGIVAGDILLSVDGAPATRIRALAERLGAESVGRKVSVKLIRAGAITTCDATITARPAHGC